MAMSPGPWRWQDDRERVLLDANGVMVLVQGDLTQADDADARLIESAPELLRHLKFFLRQATGIRPVPVGVMDALGLVEHIEGI